MKFKIRINKIKFVESLVSLPLQIIIYFHIYLYIVIYNHIFSYLGYWNFEQVGTEF